MHRRHDHRHDHHDREHDEQHRRRWATAMAGRRRPPDEGGWDGPPPPPPGPPPGRGRGRRGPDGPGWGPGGPFGPFGPGGPGRRGGPRRNRGDVRTAVLLLLREEPMHGYQLIREVGVRSGGTWRLSPGAVYPTLGVLEAEGLIAATGGDGGGRTAYALTDAGRAEADALAGRTPPWQQASEHADELHELHTAAWSLMAAVRQVAEVAGPEQRRRAVETLTESRRALYALLAEDPR